MSSPVRLNLGSGNYPLEGWTNVDAVCAADVNGDLWSLEFRHVDEVNMSHVLEHVEWRDTAALLRRIRNWMRPGGRFTVEVPDMAAIMKLGTEHPLWFKYVYGDQSTEYEQHLAGFDARLLVERLEGSGFRLGAIVRFRSEHRGRETMPCLKAWAYA